MIITKSSLRLSTNGTTIIKRSLWAWLNMVFNKVDPQRIESVGADRAASEWLIRCGAAVKWKNHNEWENDYNSLPIGDFHKYKIEEIDGTDSTIMHIGFPHLKGLEYLRKIIIKNNGYLTDESLSMLSYVRNSLVHLEIISCIGITDTGIMSLTQLDKLKHLKLYDLISVDDREKCLQTLETKLMNCTIEWPLPKKR